MIKILREYITDPPLELSVFIELAIILTEMVYREHQQNMMIGYLSPEHISVQWEGKIAYISLHTESHGAYHSPEQSSRFNIVPSGRSDLYALGIIFYELLTGQLPFHPDNDENWGTVHTRKVPHPLSYIRLGLDETLQAILMKLLAKSPMDRYQSAYGVLEDLKMYQKVMNKDGAFTSLEVGYYDKIRTFSYNDTWYGRTNEVMQMEAGLEQAFQGYNAFRWVIGEEGTGKTTLVHKLQERVMKHGGRMIEVHAGPAQQNVNYWAILQAIREWIHQLWSEPIELITRLKARLQAEFGREMQTIVYCVPEAKLLSSNDMEIIHNLDDAKAWDRFEELLPNLIFCMVECKPPLILFVDNMQWVDSGTQTVIRELLLAQKTNGLLLIGAFRTEEILTSTEDTDQEELLTWVTQRCCANSEEYVALPPLAFEDVRQFISDVLHDKSARIQLLARSVFNQSGGNPGSIRLLLEGWLRENKLKFNELRRQWVWDSGVIRHESKSEENLCLLKLHFSKLQEDYKEFLAMAATIGSVFQISLLAEVCNIPIDTTFQQLQEVAMEGFIYREEVADQEDGQVSIYVFVDESIHQMAYTFVPERTMYRHRAIGRVLQHHSLESGGDLSRIAIDHLNLAATVLSDHEKRQLIEHNLQVGQEALASRLYVQGKHYAEKGIQLLAASNVDTAGTLDVELQLVLAWSEYMGGNSTRAKELLMELNQYSDRLSRSERINIWAPLIQFNAYVDNEAAIKFGMEALASYGWRLGKKSSLLSIAKEVTRTGVLLHRKRDKRLLLSDRLDKDYDELCLILELLFLPLLAHDARTLLEFYARFIRYGLHKGVNESLVTIIGGYELIVQRIFPRYVQVTPIAEKVFQQFASNSTIKNKHVFTLLSGMFMQMDRPLEFSDALFKAMRQGLESGDHDFANQALVFCIMSHNGNLYAMKECLRYYEENMREIADYKIIQMMQLTSSYVAVLQDDSLTDSFVAVPQAGERWDDDNYSFGCRLEVAYLSGNYREALYWSQRGKENELSLDWMRVRKYRVYESLALAALFLETNMEERKRIRKALRVQLRQMKRWRGFLDSTSSAYSLIKAENERIAGNSMDALKLYTAAIKRAKTEKYVLLEAIACERLAVFYRDYMHSQTGAAFTMMDACEAYAEWGITFKVTQIRSRHADLLEPVSKRYDGPVIQERVQMNRNGTESPLQSRSQIDKSSKSEEEFELAQRLIYGLVKPYKVDWKGNFLETALRQAGAERGLLLKHRNNEFFIEAHHSDWAENEGGSVLYSESVLRHTAMTCKPLVLHDAIQSFWVRDTYISARKQRSILCMPIIVPGEKVSYLLYLENRQMPGVFTKRDVQVLELFATRIIYLKLIEEEATDAPTRSAWGNNVSSAVPSLVHFGLNEPLTEREKEITTAIAEGLSNREIADRFGIAETTVKTHTSRIYSKLGVKRRGQAVVRARELHWIE